MLCYVTWWEKILFHIILTGAFFFYYDLIEGLLKLLWEYLSHKREHRRSNIAENPPQRVRVPKACPHAAKSKSCEVVVVNEQARPLLYGYLNKH